MQFAGIPVWVYIAILLIFLSGFMAYRAMRAERKIEQGFIEKEGAVFIERMEKEKAKRARLTENSIVD